MDRTLEQAILNAISGTLNRKESIQEAKGDWITTRQVIAKIRAFSPDQNPLINLRAYGLASSGERKDYHRMMQKHVDSNYFEKYKKDHFEALKKVESGGKASRKILTRERLIELLSGVVPLPKNLKTKWNREYKEELKGLQQSIRRLLGSLYVQLADHAEKCVRYRNGTCIRGTKLDIAFEKASEGQEEPLLAGISNPDEVMRDLRAAIKLANRPDLRMVQCHPSGVESLSDVVEIIDELDTYISIKNGLSSLHLGRALDEEDFEVLRQNPRVGRAIMHADETVLPILPPLVAARPSKLEHQIVWQIFNTSGQRKFDKDVDLCAELEPYVQTIIDEHDYDDEKGFFQIHIARQLSSHYGYDKVKEAFENVLNNWHEHCEDFIAATRPTHSLSDKEDLSVAGINPTYAIPGSDEHVDYRDTGLVPRISNPEGVGVGGEYGTEHPTVHDVYNSYIGDRIPKEYGFDEDFTWVVLFGTEESAVTDTFKGPIDTEISKREVDGKCPVCIGRGFINSKTVGIPIGGLIRSEYWDIVLGDQDEIQAGGQQCSHCEGSGRVYPARWQHPQPVGDDDERAFTPFEIVFRQVWDLLIQYNPVAYDGFVTYEGELFLDEDDYPIPAPSRPEVETQYEHNREGELNTMAYTTIIRLDTPMGRNKEEVGEKFQSEFYDSVRKVLTPFRMPTDLTQVQGMSENMQDIVIYSLRREPRFTTKRWTREYTDAKGKESVREASWVSDIAEFEKEYLALVNDGRDVLVPSQQLLEELEKLLTISRELDMHRIYEISVPIAAFLEHDQEEYGNRARLIPNYDKLVKIGREASYGDLIRYCLEQLGKYEEEKDRIRSYETYDRVLTQLLAKSNLYDVELPGEGVADLSKVTDINEELKLYINYKDRVRRMQRRSLFKPGTRGEGDNKIKGIEDVLAIARRINEVFKNTAKLHPQSNIPLNAKDNPVFSLLVPLGYEYTAQSIAGIDDMKVVEILVTGGDDGFEPHPSFQDTKARRALARFYWKAQIEDRPLLDVMEDEMREPGQKAEYLSVREIFPNYGIVHEIAKSFEDNNDKYPERALTQMFAEGIKLTQGLFRSASEEDLEKVYRKEKTTPEKDLKKLDTFLKAARYRLTKPSVKARMHRNNKRARDHTPQVEEEAKKKRENQEWKNHFNDLIADFFDLDEEEIDEEDESAYLETEIFVTLKMLIAAAAQVMPEYATYAQIANDYPATFMRQISPMFRSYLENLDPPIMVDLHNLVYPGLDAIGEADKVLEVFQELSNAMGLKRVGGKLKIGDRPAVRKFFRKLMKNTTKDDSDANT